MTVELEHYLVVGAILFGIGLFSGPFQHKIIPADQFSSPNKEDLDTSVTIGPGESVFVELVAGR